MTRPCRAIVVLSAVVGFGLVAAGCSSGGQAATSGTTTTPLPDLTKPSDPAPAVTTPTVTVHGHTCTVPTENGTQPIDSAVDTGGQIILTDKGFLPHRLFADLNQTITWTNLSGRPVRITFVHQPTPIRSPVIPFCGTFTYSSKLGNNIYYVSSSGFYGFLGIGDFQS